MTDGECEIFAGVISKGIKWLWVSAPTRYGKTETIAMAIVYLAVVHHLKIPVVAGSQEKANKIMEYVIMHLGDHPDLYRSLINVKDFQNIERLKITVSKEALHWALGGWIYVTSVDSRSLSKEGEGVVGEGGDVVILEEAGLIKKKDQFSKIVRMPEEDKGWGKLIMSGNCIENSVFEDGFKNPIYKKVRISLEQAIKEGRYTQDFLEQKKSQTTSKDWKRYYLVEFPLANEFTYFKPKVYELLPKDLQYWGSIDPSLGESKKGSKIGIIVLGRDKKNGQIYEVDSVVQIMKPEEATRVIFNMPYTFQLFMWEAIQFQKYFLNITQEKSKVEKRYIPFKGITQSKKKEERIESLEPIINTGQILFKGENELWDEMQDYPESEYLDGLDALEMAYRGIIGGNFEYSFV